METKVRIVGKGKQPVVLVHGFGNAATMWLPYIVSLRSDYTFYLPDLPGFGNHRGTLPPPGTGVLEHYAKYLQQVIDETGHESVMLAGYSLGALTSLQLHASGGFGKVSRYLHIDHSPCPKRMAGWDGGIHPELWKRFEEITALVDQAPGQELVELGSLREPIASHYLRLLEILGEKSITLPVFKVLNRVLHRTPVIKNWAASRASWPWSYAVIRGYLRGDYDFRDSLKTLKIPTTVAGGKRSELFGPAAVQAMKDALPNGRFIEFSRSGHDLVFNEPIHFARVLETFLSAK